MNPWGKLLLVFWVCWLLNACGSSDQMGTSTPQVVLSADNLTFGEQVVNTISDPLTVTVTNTGKATLKITSIAVSANFAETDDCSSGVSVGGTCTINVTLVPASEGSLSGTLSLTDNAPPSPQTISLNGTGVAADAGGGGGCSVAPQQCHPKCCPGYVCVPASTRAFCVKNSDFTEFSRQTAGSDSPVIDYQRAFASGEPIR